MTLIFEEGTKPIESVGGDLIAFIGRSSKGPTLDPVLVTTPPQYEQTFGDHTEGRPLWHAVQGFFANGGVRCYVVNLGETASPTAALDALATADETLSVLAFPGSATPQHYAELVERLEADQHWFALFDGPQERPEGGLDAIPKPPSTPWAMLLYPWITAQDPSEGAIDVPPSGHVAGIMARRERESNVAASPAGQILRGALGASDLLTEEDLAKHLKPNRVNAIYNVKNRGWHLWGDATLAEDERPRVVSTARRHLLLLRSIQIGTRWAAKREESEAVRHRLEEEIRTYLERVRDSDVLPGQNAAEAYAIDTTRHDDDPETELVLRVELYSRQGKKIPYTIRHTRASG